MANIRQALGYSNVMLPWLICKMNRFKKWIDNGYRTNAKITLVNNISISLEHGLSCATRYLIEILFIPRQCDIRLQKKCGY